MPNRRRNMTNLMGPLTLCRCSGRAAVGKPQQTLKGHEGLLDNAEIQGDLRLSDGSADRSSLLLSNFPLPVAEERRLGCHGPVLRAHFYLSTIQRGKPS